jgi:hypothetical protein
LALQNSNAGNGGDACRMHEGARSARTS